ncbi:MAG: DUF192 domain-containing protein [Bacilli bacterium]
MLKFDNVKIKTATKFKERLFGLMFKKNISYGIFFKNCRSIHTFFMLESIDIVATNKNDDIIKTYKEVKPWRIIIAPKEAKNIYELPKKTL